MDSGCEVCRGWRAFLFDTRHWLLASLDPSLTGGGGGAPLLYEPQFAPLPLIKVGIVADGVLAAAGRCVGAGVFSLLRLNPLSLAEILFQQSLEYGV